MVSKVRDATREERNLAKKIANEFTSNAKILAGQAEELGYRFINREEDHVSILTPEKKIFQTDLNREDLDNLRKALSKEDLSGAIVYSTIIFTNYKEQER